jgi:hypothetical protein
MSLHIPGGLGLEELIDTWEPTGGLRRRNNINPHGPSGNDPNQDSRNAAGDNNSPDYEKQCRICFGADNDPELGRLIRPCLCKGTISVSDHSVRSVM